MSLLQESRAFPHVPPNCVLFTLFNESAARVRRISFICHLSPSFLRLDNTKYLLHAFHAIPTLHLFVCSSLSHSLSHLAGSTLQIIAENLQSCTASLLLFNWDFLIHTFSLLMAPTAKHYQKEQTICAYHTLPSSLLSLKANRWKCSLFIPIQDTFTWGEICLHVRQEGIQSV